MSPSFLLSAFVFLATIKNSVSPSGKKYSKIEVDKLMDLAEERLPLGSEEWQSLTTEYNVTESTRKRAQLNSLIASASTGIQGLSEIEASSSTDSSMTMMMLMMLSIMTMRMLIVVTPALCCRRPLRCACAALRRPCRGVQFLIITLITLMPL
jgi:hypothetical protein